MQRLKKHYGELLYADIIAINYFGDYVQEHNGHVAVWPALITESNQKDIKEPDAWGRNIFMKMLKENDYDGIFMIHDPATIGVFLPFLKQIKEDKKINNRKLFKSILYFPIDGVGQGNLTEGFEFFDTLVTYTEFARSEVFKFNPSLKGKLNVIYHGVDTKTFCPLDGRERFEFRNSYFGDNTHKTIVANINRNQPRKDIPTTILAFEHYLRNFNSNAFLYLHMEPLDPNGWKLPVVLSQTSLKEGVDYMFPKKSTADIPADYLNVIMNACDVFLNTTCGEGWGLSLTEAFACKLPIIAPLHTSINEIAGHNSCRLWDLEAFIPYCSHFDNQIRYTVDYVEAAERINQVVTNKEHTQKMIELAYEWSQKISWDNICKRWIDVFEKYF